MRINFFSRVAAALLLLSCSVATFAQVMTVTGKVTLKQADGTEVPVKDAVIDFYRLDISSKFQVKTDKNGQYVHAGIPMAGTFTLAVSAPGARPTFMTNLKINHQSENNFTLTPGDGSRLTLEQIKAGAAGGSSPNASGAAKASAEDKAKAAEMEKKIKEIEEGNKKIEASNAIVKRTFDAGNEAYRAKNYDQALTLFDEGLAARPEETGLLVSKSFALIGRGVKRFNDFIQNKDEAAKEGGFKDWREAAELSLKALNLLNAGTPPTDPAAQANAAQNKLAALTARAEAMKFVSTKVDKTKEQAEAAFKAYQDLLAVETDPAKKTKLPAEAAKVLFDANEYGRAAEEYQKVLAIDPDNADANLYLGFALFNTGDKAKFQEAANYIARFVEKAPDTNPTKAEAKSILDFLKTQENIKPEKIQTARPGRRRG